MPSGNAVADHHWVNDNDIGNEEILWRRINPRYIKRPASPAEQYTASQQAYRTEEISVYVASRTSVQAVLSQYPNDSLTAISARFVRDLGLIIVRDPNDTDPNPAHRLIGRQDHISITAGTAKRIAVHASWVVLKDPDTAQVLIGQ